MVFAAAAATSAANDGGGGDGWFGQDGQFDHVLPQLTPTSNQLTLPTGTPMSKDIISQPSSATTASRVEVELMKELEDVAATFKDVFTDQTDSCIVESLAFKAIVFMLVLVNAVVMGVEVDNPQHEDVWRGIHHALALCFVVEMIIKITALRLVYFSDAWNLMDFGLAILAFLDTWIMTLLQLDDAGMGNFSVLRALRLLRLMRLARLFKQLGKVVIVMRSIVEAIESTVWVCCVLALCLYVSAIICVKHIGHAAESTYPGYSKNQEDIDNQEVMQNFNPYVTFGNMPRAMMTLFNLAILAEWHEIVRPVMLKQPMMSLFFLILAVFVCFGVMNVIIGMIVDAVMQNSRQLEREVEQAHRRDKIHLLKQLKDMVFHLDEDGDNGIQPEELDRVMKHDPQFRQVFSKISLPYGCSGGEFLSLLDNDGDGMLDPNEFVSSLYRLINCGGFQQTCLLQMGVNDIKRAVRESGETTRDRISKLEAMVSALSAKLAGVSTPSSRSPRGAAGPANCIVKVEVLQPTSSAPKQSMVDSDEEITSIFNSLSADIGYRVQSSVRDELFGRFDCIKAQLASRLDEAPTTGPWEPIQQDRNFLKEVSLDTLSPCDNSRSKPSPLDTLPSSPPSSSEQHNVHPFSVPPPAGNVHVNNPPLPPQGLSSTAFIHRRSQDSEGINTTNKVEPSDHEMIENIP